MPGSQGSKTRPKMENIAMNSDDKQCRLPLVRRGSAPEVFELLDLRRRNVADANVFALLANCPDILKPFLDMADAVRDGYGLDPVLRELAVIMTCQSLDNRYEQVRHWNIARRLGVPAEKLALIGEFEVSEEFRRWKRQSFAWRVTLPGIPKGWARKSGRKSTATSAINRCCPCFSRSAGTICRPASPDPRACRSKRTW